MDRYTKHRGGSEIWTNRTLASLIVNKEFFGSNSLWIKVSGLWRECNTFVKVSGEWVLVYPKVKKRGQWV